MGVVLKIWLRILVREEAIGLLVVPLVAQALVAVLMAKFGVIFIGTRDNGAKTRLVVATPL
jgi:hypothetical protein